jgi:hypothetical protein
MWESLKEKLSAAQAAAPATAQTPAPTQQQPSMLGTILREAVKMVGPIIAGVVANAGETAHDHDGTADSEPGKTS